VHGHGPRGEPGERDARRRDEIRDHPAVSDEMDDRS
jgi:hypothetical protein